MKIAIVMDSSSFASYLTNISSDYHNLAIDLLSKYYMFANDIILFEAKLSIAKVILRYFNEDLILSSEDSFEINILNHDETIRLSEILNKCLNVSHKPTFLTDVDNYKSITQGGY